MGNSAFALVIDDEYEICLLIENILSLKKISCKIAHNLETAKNILQNYKPDFIFLDQNLPDGLGFDTIPYFKEKVNGVKVVAMTAQSDLHKESALRSGADAFLSKPFAVQEIFSALDSFRE